MENQDWELTYPPQTHQKYTYMQKKSHRKLIGNWQKNSYTTKAARKISTEQGKTEDRHQFWTPDPERNLKGRDVLHGLTLSWESKQVDLQPGCPCPGEQHGRDKSCWLLGEVLGQREGLEKHRFYPRTMCVLVCRQSGHRELFNGGYCLTALPNPNGVSISAPPTPHHSLA